MNTNPQSEKFSTQQDVIETTRRRYFLKGAIGISVGATLLLIGAIDKVFKFFFGPRLSQDEEMGIMHQRIDRLKATVSLCQLELEREQSNYILIASLAELDGTTGKYFTDYQMRPALAFKGKDGFPMLLSAKCTHLGCTVGNQVDAQGKILCPCHVSYFDVNTGEPDANSPAKEPLAHIAWVLMDKKGKVIASRSSTGEIKGNSIASALEGANVYIAKKDA